MKICSEIGNFSLKCRAYNLEIESAILSGSYDKKETEISGARFDTNKMGYDMWQGMDNKSNYGTATGW